MRFLKLRLIPMLIVIAIAMLVTESFSSCSAPLVQMSDKQRGVSWVGGRNLVTEAQIQPLIENNVNWIAQTPFGWQQNYNSPSLDLITSGVLWGETDSGLETTTRLARGAGIKTLLKPHIWLRNRQGGNGSKRSGRRQCPATSATAFLGADRESTCPCVGPTWIAFVRLLVVSCESET